MFVIQLRWLSRRFAAALSAIALTLTVVLPMTAQAEHAVIRAAAPNGAIKHILVIALENENYSATFGSSSPAVYLNRTLLTQGELIPNYFGTSHVSLGNYVSQISGQGTNPSLNNDCLNIATFKGGYTDVFPGIDSLDQANFPGQVVGDGCVFPAPAPGVRGAQTIGDQLDRAHTDEADDDHDDRILWREYAEDMGNDVNRDFGSLDPLLIGADCAHPAINGADLSNSAAANDQYATRHNGFMYFHSVIDDQTRCNRHVVPLGTVTVDAAGLTPDAFQGHLYRDLRRIETTPKFMFVTPNLCNDGHDATCKGLNTEGTHVGGLVGLDLWLKHWMPMIFASPAYQSGKMLVVVTFDEANPVGAAGDTRACEKSDQADCGAPTGPNLTNPGYSPLLGLLHFQTDPGTTPYIYAGGGQVGAVLFNKRLIQAGSTNSTGSYNHYSALRSYEDLLGLRRGGDDGLGHLGYAGSTGLLPFGLDVFNTR